MSAAAKKRVSNTFARVSQSYWPVLILLGTFFAYLLAKCRLGIGIYDEGLSLLGAQNVLEGQIPNRDFWAVYPPGGFYFDAALFQIFGSSIFVERMAGIIITFLAVICIFLIAKYITNQQYAVVSSILAIWALLWIGVGLSLALLLALVACIYLFHLRTYDGTRDVLVLGLITALTFLFRVDVGLYLFIALSVILILCNYSGAMSVSRPKGKLYNVVKVWGIYVSGILIIAVPVLILILHAVPLQDLIDQFIVFPRSVYPAFRSLPPPLPFYGNRQLRAFFYFPIVVYLAAFLWLGAQVTRHKTKLNEQSKPLFLLLFGALLFIYGSIRIDLSHLTPTLIISVILFSWLVFSLIEEIRRTLKQRTTRATSPALDQIYLFTMILVALLLILLLFGALLFIYGSARIDLGHLTLALIVSVILCLWLVFSLIEEIRRTLKQRTTRATSPAVNLIYLFTIILVVLLLLSSALPALNPAQGGLVALDMNRARGIYINADEARNLTDATAFIQAHVPKNETIFVGNTQHEQIFANNAMFYFLAERASATKYYDLHPGVATTAAVQNQIINDIVTHDTKYVVLWNATTATLKEPNQSQYKSGIENLDNFFRDNFTLVARYGDYMIYTRGEASRRSVQT